MANLKGEQVSSREADKFNDNFKPVTAEVNCPSCGSLVQSYTMQGYTNELVTMRVKHADGNQCNKQISLLDAHTIEASATRKTQRRQY